MISEKLLSCGHMFELLLHSYIAMQSAFRCLSIQRYLLKPLIAQSNISPAGTIRAIIEDGLTRAQPGLLPAIRPPIWLSSPARRLQLHTDARPCVPSRSFCRPFSAAADVAPSRTADKARDENTVATESLSREGKAQVQKKTRGQAIQSPLMAQQRRMKITTVSPNLLAEPYRGEPPKLPWTAYLRAAGWKERYRRVLGSVKSVYTLAKCRRNLGGFELTKFKSEALQIYENVNQMIADGERNKLQHIVTPGEMTNVKKQLRAREQGGWKRISWSLAAQPQQSDLELLRGRMLALDPKDEDQMFAQLTVRIRARHRFAAFDGRDHLVAGDLAAEVPVQDVWVFEHSFRKGSQAKWRVAGRLGGIPPTAPHMGMLRRIAGLLGGQSRTN